MQNNVRNRSFTIGKIGRILLLILVAAFLYGAGVEFYNISWGTGAWIGEFSVRWGFAFLAFIIFEVVCFWGVSALLWQPEAGRRFFVLLASKRSRLGYFRWIIAAFILIILIWVLQYTPWGVVFNKPYLRLFAWGLTSFFVAFLFTKDSEHITNWRTVLAGTLISGTGFTVTSLLAGVSNYPFSLDWSEGNRLWDYSLLFGKSLYNYSPKDSPIAYLDLGRQFVGGLPFLLPHVSIVGERLWIAGMGILPYVLLGALAFRPATIRKGVTWILAVAWVFIFLNQGPIHAPLIFAAILVGLAWRQPLWFAFPLLVVSGYFAELSRFTWMFAPAMWIILLEFGGVITEGERIDRGLWLRPLELAAAGLLGSGLSILQGQLTGQEGLVSVTSASTQQPLLWYRLFPNATYGTGILVGLLIALGPLIVILSYFGLKHWKLNLVQKLSIVLSLIAFLAVGLVVSTKIGGGGDLHNMDMFLIGLMFTSALAWRAGGEEWLVQTQDSSIWIQAILLLLITIPAFQPLMTLRPLSFARDENWLVVLADVQKPKDLGSLPSKDALSLDMEKLRNDVKAAQSQGEVLFMDQRQLLTFDFIQNIKLVPEYEKKRMMDEALSENPVYFHPFYQDLAAHRFSLIISDPLRTPIKDSDYGFGEENNAWVKWVAKPVLCYYEEKDTLTDVKIELLIPQKTTTNCSATLP